jgi:uncharacterized membrane protein
MRMTQPGLIIFAAAFVGLGVLGLWTGDFAMNWQPVPAGIAGRAALAYLSGALLLIGGVSLLVPRLAAFGAALLSANLLVWLLLLEIPRLFTGAGHEVNWLGLGETLVLLCGAWILFCEHGEKWLGAMRAAKGVRLGKYLFALALFPIGLSHLVYAAITAAMVPAWLPTRFAFAIGTGAAHIATGGAIILKVVARTAALLEAIMMSLFTLLIWVPNIVATPDSRGHWTAFFASLAITGGAFVVWDALRKDNA